MKIRRLLDIVLGDVSDQASIRDIAERMGVERRLNYRVQYPEVPKLQSLPRVFFEDYEVKVSDLSVGGLCIESAALEERLKVGEDYEFRLQWYGHSASAWAKLIAVSHKRVHWQFLGLSDAVRDQIDNDVLIGLRGSRMRGTTLSGNENIESVYQEIWQSSDRERLILFNEDSSDYATWIPPENWGVAVTFSRKFQNPLDWTLFDLDQFLVFLVNIQKPSSKLKAFIEHIRELRAHLEWSQ